MCRKKRFKAKILVGMRESYSLKLVELGTWN
jgi:hypothetical protein